MKNHKLIRMHSITIIVVVCILLSTLFVILFGYQSKQIARQQKPVTKPDTISGDTIIVTADADYEPYTFYTKDGHLSGHDLEFVYELAKRIQCNVIVKLLPWSDAINAVKNGTADLVLTYPGNDTTQSTLITSIPYVNDPFIAFGRTDFAAVGDLYGKKLAALEETGCVSNFLVPYHLADCTTLYHSNRDAFKSVMRGENDYVIARYSVGRREIAMQGIQNEIHSVGPVLLNSTVCIAANSTNKALIQKINEAIITTSCDGTLNALSQKWLGNYVHTISITEFIKQNLYLWGIIITGVILVFLLLYTINLRKTMEKDEQLKVIMENITGAITAITVKNNVPQILFANDRYYTMLGFTKEEYEAEITNPHVLIHPDDRERVYQETKNASNTKMGTTTVYRIIRRDKTIRWWQADISIISFFSINEPVQLTINTDITESKIAEQQLSDIINTMPCGISLQRWQNNTLTPVMVNQRYTEMLGEDALSYMCSVKNLYYTHVHPDDRERLQKESYEALTGTQKIDTVYRSLNVQTNEYLWIRLRGSVRQQPDGSQLAFINYFDITQERLEKQKEIAKLERELKFKKSSMFEENLIAYSVHNITQGKTQECRYRNGTAVPDSDRTDFDYSTINGELLIDEKERNEFIALNNAQKLIESFNNGETEFKIDFRRKIPNGKVIWVRNNLHLLRDPETNDVLLFQFWYDIDSEKTREQLYESIAKASYDLVALIDGKTKHFDIITHSEFDCHMPPKKGDNADTINGDDYSNCILEEDRETVTVNSQMEQVNQWLQKNGSFEFSYRMTRPDGTMRYKRITYYYIDTDRQLIGMTREDVTDLLREESEKNKLLVDALREANQASVAKSQFLSRVSHELRTPLNAIIGYNTLAQDGLENTNTEQAVTKATDCLSKSDIASRHLLTIINDVLDMSAIESGKITISDDRFNFKELISSMSTVFYPQATAKNIDFEVILDKVIDEWLIGDQVRINQILANLVSNAIKFTHGGGKVTIGVQQTDIDDKNIQLNFCISDTGIGMSDEYLRHIWTPFEQADASISRRFGGTGLGLSITKNLIDLMNGTITVESEQGKGSAFYVTLVMKRTEQQLKDTAYDFNKINALVVDDDQGTCDYLKLLLNKFGARCGSALSGMDALQQFSASITQNDPYTLCLVDWRMPEMDGLETIKHIRDIAGTELPIIVISAYDFSEIAEKADEVGVNLFIAKPLFPSALLDMLASIYGHKEDLRNGIPYPDKNDQNYTFPNCRILLTEDNEMNMEVAKMILESAQIAVDTAWNGKEAVAMFTKAPEGTYDMLLMDVQMPVMNGYEATKAIRTSGHPEGKTIPIIAMTADAFAENVVEAKNAGMNDHVAKPINIAYLFETLKKYLHNDQKTANT